MTPTIREFVLAMGSSLPASVVAKATVVAAFGLMGARLARRSRAAVRHVVLAAAFGVLLLLPVISFVAPPVGIGIKTVGHNDEGLAPVTETIQPPRPTGSADGHPALGEAPSKSWVPSLSMLLVMVWFLGTAFSLATMIAGLCKISSLRRAGLPWAEGQVIVDNLARDAGIHGRVEVLVNERLPGPIASGIFHPVILLPVSAENWESENLNRALMHELEHVRRGDAVIHSLARAVCAVYWFHPLVWCMWRGITLEAERSCDDAVIARSEATGYAEQLVNLARQLAAGAKPPVPYMANRSDLAIRVGAVLDTRQRRGRARPIVVVLGCFATAIALTMSPLRTISKPQFAGAQGAAGTVGSGAPVPSFEVASIKPNRSGSGFIRIETPKGRLIVTSITVKYLICWAFAGISLPLRGDQVLGGPSWINSERYDIDAKLEDSQVAALDKLSPPDRIVQLRLGVQSLLADRFKLVVKHTTEDRPAYALVIAKTGPKLQETVPGSPSPIRGADGRPMGMWMGPDQLRAHEIPIASLAMGLSNELGRTVLDQTGLKGKYDVELKWTPDLSALGTMPGSSSGGGGSEGAPPPDASGPSIFTAIQEQLGLKLEATKGPVEILVIDHVERPSAN